MQTSSFVEYSFCLTSLTPGINSTLTGSADLALLGFSVTHTKGISDGISVSRFSLLSSLKCPCNKQTCVCQDYLAGCVSNPCSHQNLDPSSQFDHQIPSHEK